MSDVTQQRIMAQLAAELNVRVGQVAATVGLIDEGATIPFIARYRKEVTEGLDDTQLRNLEERLLYLRELETRREAIVQSIREQDKLNPELQAQLENAKTKQELEDLYLPFKPKRRTRAQIAREAGLEPLALALLTDASLDPQVLAQTYLNPEANILDVKAALDGARDILAENFAERAELLGKLREFLWKNAVLAANVVAGKEEEGEKFRDYFKFSETIKTIPSHRALALFRGREQGFLQIKLDLAEILDEDTPKVGVVHPCEGMIASQVGISAKGQLADKFLADCCRWAWRVKIHPTLETELLTQLREASELEAIKVFGRNLKDLLLAAPAGNKAVIGLDPGIRTGVKVAVVDGTGKLLQTTTIYPHQPRNEWDKSIEIIAALAKQYQVALVAIGNGTASRETDRLTLDMMKRYPELNLQKIVVSEAGASVYSASELAANEFPDLDVSLRGAVSIARRLQDPLAELVKIDPKSIGVGQYQHDVNQRELARQLDAVVEDCVNAVGVDVNTASPALLARVSGLNSVLAKNIVQYRNENGGFKNRSLLKKVPRLGDKTFEQAAGFLRVVNGDNPLDASAVHPESYRLVEKILAKIGKEVREVMAQPTVLQSITAQQFVDEQFGLPTVRDVLQELEKPGRDPRPEFKAAQFKEGVEDIKDLRIGMILEGVISNVANFGAFVDIGVHQDGLVHVSALSTKFVKDPHEVVKAGDLVKVKVLEVDIARKRISLTMRLDDEPGQQVVREARSGERSRDSDRGGAGKGLGGAGQHKHASKSEASSNNAMAAAFAKLQR